MLSDGIELFGLGAAESVPGMSEPRLVRVPQHIRSSMEERGRFVAADSSGIELRFVTDAPLFDLYLSAPKPEFAPRPFAVAFRGGFRVCTLELEPGKINCFRLSVPPAFQGVKHAALSSAGYAPSVWRIQFHLSPFTLHGIDTFGYALRKPYPSELPSLIWLAYGSSITHSHANGYPYLTSRLLNAQMRNLGMNGACHLEKAMADYLAEECRFDFITCEAGVNMYEHFSPEEFQRRAAYLAQRLDETGKPAILISSFANARSYPFCAENSQGADRQAAFRSILRDLVQNQHGGHLYFVDGFELLGSLDGLGADLLHPTEAGHAAIARNLAPKLRDILRQEGIPGF